MQDDLRRGPPWVQDLMGDKEQLAAYLATCKHDWQTSDDRTRVGRECRNDLDTPIGAFFKLLRLAYPTLVTARSRTSTRSWQEASTNLCVDSFEVLAR